MRSKLPVILVIEDDFALRSLIAMTLDILGTVHELGDGSAAIDAVRRLQPDLVLLDISLGGELSGLDICRRLRLDGDASACRIVLISGRSEPAEIAIGLAAGADAYLTKPFTHDGLVGLVAGLLGS